MIIFLVRRLVSLAPTLLGITLVAFTILNLLPEDPGATWRGAAPSAETVQRLRTELGADRPTLARYGLWLGALLRGDLGRSLRDGREVTSILAEALPWSLLLNLGAICLIYGFAIPFGLYSALVPGSRADRIGAVLLLVLYALPSFAAALLLQETFAVRLGLLPLQGVSRGPDGASPADLLRHLVLPTVCLALSGWAFVARYARASFRSAMGQEFLRVARSKGLSRWRAARHLTASAAVPLVTLVTVILPGLVGGSVIVEQAFSWPGLGRLYLAALEGRDYPVVLALTLLSAVAVLLGQLVTDLFYMVVDPRLRQHLLAGSSGA